MVEEQWKTIRDFDQYSVSSYGRVRNDKSGRMLLFTPNQYGVVCVGLMRDLKQYNRSVPRLVVSAFIPRVFGAFDTPINLNGDRWDNHIDNLLWRPRWFAIQYNQQFIKRYQYPINKKIIDQETKEEFRNSFICAQKFGLLERDVVLSILNRTYVWPTYQMFEVAS